MKKAGFLRRVFILVLFGAGWSRLVIQNPEIIQDPDHAWWLQGFLYAAIGWGVATMLADRLGRP